MLVLLCVVSSSSVFAFSFQAPPTERTGAPGEANCTLCHSGNALNTTGGSLILTVPETYTPGMEYDIVVQLSRAGQSRWGFQMTALNSNNARAGTINTSDGNTQLKEANSKQYISHTSAGTAQQQWMYKWTAPSTDIGPVTFYAAGNAANGNFGTTGDYIYTQKATSESIAYGVTLAGVGTLSKTANTGVETSYTLRVTNTGNTSDTISLSTSGVTSARLSQDSVALDANASTNVTLTIPGTALTSAGQYKAMVTASSQGDSSKTAQITTTTTVPNAYGVTLAGVGNLTKETADASSGVTYSIRVTNTGNTSDTISLTTSGDATATISPSTLLINQGDSHTVTLTVPGNALTKAGAYEVNVTATSQGDDTETAEITTTTTVLHVYDIALEGVGELTTETADASDGVTYVLKVTNNGNTDDVIDLATQGIPVTLSQTSVTLASGASAEVMLTISGDVLALASEYYVRVTATSQGDNNQTAETTATITVLPVYGVTLASDTLTGTTMDMVAGVTYTLTVTNTGNTDDTLLLSSSAEVGIGGAVLGSFNLPNSEEPDMAQLEIMLGAGESAEVEFTASGDLLTQPGEYEIVVTATSQRDDTESVEVTTTTTILPVYGVTLASDTLTGTTTDMVAGVTYTLTVTNTGNTNDTIVLGSSAEVGIGGAVLGSFNLPNSEEPDMAQLEIMLGAGESAEVEFTASGDLLTQPGEYEIVVTATSQGDTEKTAQLTTTTTIAAVPPEYGVNLEGVGELKGATWDFLTGVTYTLKVTNTGNTEDTIVIGSSAEVGIEGSVLGAFSLSDDEEVPTSQLTLTLASGASTDVFFTASGDLFTKLGDYEIVVTATSQGDTTKTAEITTTTTIQPVPWDLNADGKVNILDLVAVANQFGETGEGISGDVNMDGTVNILDLVAVANQFGKTSAEIVQANQ